MIEKDIKEKEAKLKVLKTRPVEVLEGEEGVIASKEKRDPKLPKQLIAAEETRVLQAKNALKEEIKNLNAKLD